MLIQEIVHLMILEILHQTGKERHGGNVHVGKRQEEGDWGGKGWILLGVEFFFFLTATSYMFSPF